MEPTTEDLSVFNAEESPIRYLSEDEEEVSTKLKDSSEEEERPAKNVVTGKDFAKLTKKARKLGAESLDFSPRKNNRYVATLQMDRKFILVPPNIQIFLSIKIMLEKRDILGEQRKLKTKGVNF